MENRIKRYHNRRTKGIFSTRGLFNLKLRKVYGFWAENVAVVTRKVGTSNSAEKTNRLATELSRLYVHFKRRYLWLVRTSMSNILIVPLMDSHNTMKFSM
jgi:hypothetical protein